VIERNIGDSLKRLQGQQKIVPEPMVGVSLRPNDPLAKRMPSTAVETRNVLIKVTMPKRTGRKRKRGSDDPFEFPDPP